jgi:hypothetical protein
MESVRVEFCASKQPALASSNKAAALALLERFKICKNVMNVLIGILTE